MCFFHNYCKFCNILSRYAKLFGFMFGCFYTAPTIMDLNLLACMLTHTSSIPFDDSPSVISLFSHFLQLKMFLTYIHAPLPQELRWLSFLKTLEFLILIKLSRMFGWSQVSLMHNMSRISFPIIWFHLSLELGFVHECVWSKYGHYVY